MAVPIEEQTSVVEEREDEHGEPEPELEEEKMEDAYDVRGLSLTISSVTKTDV